VIEEDQKYRKYKRINNENKYKERNE